MNHLSKNEQGEINMPCDCKKVKVFQKEYKTFLFKTIETIKNGNITAERLAFKIKEVDSETFDEKIKNGDENYIKFWKCTKRLIFDSQFLFFVRNHYGKSLEEILKEASCSEKYSA